MAFIGFDLEGPISSMDHAFEVCKRYVPDGDRLYPVLSRYDDLLALENRESYEPGYTLKLQIPFLIAADVSEENLRTISREAGFVPGIQELFSWLRKGEPNITGIARRPNYINIISTSYQQHAWNIGERLGVSLHDIYSTLCPLEEYRRFVSQEQQKIVLSMREKVVELYVPDLESGKKDGDIKDLLDPFFWHEIPRTNFSRLMEEIEVNGGRNKLLSLQNALIFSKVNYLKDAIVIGDSITDWRMLRVVEDAGGLAVAWNANQYALPWATCAVAAVDARAMRPIIQEFAKGGRPAVREWIETVPAPFDPDEGAYYHWIAGKKESELQDILAIHKKMRTACRGAETARLG